MNDRDRGPRARDRSGHDREALLASIADTSPDGIVSVDAYGIVRWASPGTKRVLGWAAEEIVGKHVSVIAAEQPNAGQRGQCLRVLDGGEIPEPYIVTLIRRDGSHVDATVALGPVRSEQGAVAGVTAIIREMTVAEASQRELIRAVEDSRARFEQVSMPQAQIDLETQLVAVNAAWSQLFGYEEDDLVGRGITTLVHPVDVEHVEEKLGPLRRGEMESTSFELLGRQSDGRRLPLLVDATVLRDPDGAPYAVAAFARDLTEIKEARRKLAAQENLYRALNRRSSDAAIVMDADLNIVYVSPGLTDMLGYDQEQVLTVLGWDLVHRDDLERIRPLVDAVVFQPEHTERFTFRIQDASGAWRWVEETLTNCVTDPDIGGLIANLRDVTAEVDAQQATRVSEARYRAIVETAQEGILVIAPDGGAVFANETMGNMLGMTLGELYASDAARLLSMHECEDSGTAEDGQQRRVERSYAHPDGTRRTLLLSSSPLHIDGDLVEGTLVMVWDVTAFRHAETELRHRALHDPLTHLPNRYLLSDRLEMAAAREQRTDGPGTAVMFLDLDRFKVVNDRHGHDVGDRLLQQVASRLSGAVRAADTVARLGGDEFAVICEDADIVAAQAVAERIHGALRDPIPIGELTFTVSASIGVALSPALQPSELLRRADAAMYRAKEAGGAVTIVSDGGG